MDANKTKAYEILREAFPNYTVGVGVLKEVGPIAASFGKKALVVCNNTYMKPVLDEILGYLKDSDVEVAGGQACPDAKPNAPREDVYRITTYVLDFKPDCIVAVGGGSTIDACKAASMLATLGSAYTPEIDGYFGTGIVTEQLAKTGKKLVPVVAVETSASSGAHLTKYSNITDPVVGQKKLIVDPAIVPARPIFDYKVTCSMPLSVTIDGALDSIAHTIEVFWGAKPETYEKTKALFEAAAGLTTTYAKEVIKDPKNVEAREAIGLSTDLGGYAIMVGGTSGGHLTSFSLVDCVGHGTACGLMNPYYAVFYSKAIQPQLHVAGNVFKKAGYAKDVDFDKLEGRALAVAVAEAMIEFGKSIGAPTKLTDLPKFKEDVHIPRAVAAAKDPALKMKLQNMPVPMTADDVDEYMLPILKAAASGDLSLIKEM